MPTTLTLNQIAEKNKQHASNRWVVLLVLRPPSDITGVLPVRLARSNSSITYDSNTYIPFNFTPSKITESSDGDFPGQTIVINNPHHFLDSFLEDTNGCERCTLEMFVVNTGYLADPPPVIYKWDVDSIEQDDESIAFLLGMPSALRRMIPDESYRARSCQFPYSTSYPCKVVHFDIGAIGLVGSDPVSITLTDHPFATDDVVVISAVTGIDDLNGNYTVTNEDANTISLQGTDSSDFSGSYSSGGKIGFRFCNGTIPECVARNNINRLKAFPGLRSRTVSYI